jgi:hypothetical protein
VNRAWFVLWALVIWQIAAWTFAPAPPPADLPAGDGKPFGTNEAIAVESRQLTRKSALEALDRPWSERCGEHRKTFIRGLNYYYYHRQNQTERYAENHGKPGADYIAGQWLTADDMRIERLTQEAYALGYIAPPDFDGVASKLVSALVMNERVTGHGCAD